MLSTDNDVLFNWTLITSDKTDKEDVLLEIIKLCITTRGFSFVKSVMEKYPKKRKAKSRGQRTRLFTDKM